jgi:hypothetical protein
MTTSAVVRKEADRALRQYFLPTLRNLGFKGSGRHFRRILEDRIDLVTVQFGKWGGSYCVNLAVCSPQGLPGIPQEKVTAFDVLPGPRVRLTLDGLPGDCWFRYFNAHGGPHQFEGTPEECAKAAAAALSTHGETFFLTTVRPWLRAGSQ